MTADWSPLIVELDRWKRGGRAATLWWRDDDVHAYTEALGRLLGLARRHAVAPGLAAIPALVDVTLGAALTEYPEVRLLQHGYVHLNHATKGEKKIELGGRRSLDTLRLELAEGAARLAALYPARILPALVPPWNRIACRLLPWLAPLGFRILSGFGPRPAREVAAGLVQVNTHVDIIDWHGTRGCRPHAALITDLVAHLRARRETRADQREPTGILSHHLNHDAACWDFLETLFECTSGHAGARWIGVSEALR